VNGRLSVDQSPRSLLIRQTVDDVQGQGSVATQDPKVVDDEEEGYKSWGLTSITLLMMCLSWNFPVKMCHILVLTLLFVTVTSEADEEKRVLTSEPEQAKNEEKATTSQLLGEMLPQ
jgi:hypothetical protein